jgi:DNA repair protein RadC
MNKAKQLVVSKDMLPYLKFIRHKRQEYLLSLSLDSAGRLITRRTVTIGLLDVSLAHPREVFTGPLKDRAARVVIAHNHPSGEAEPSNQDITTTQQLIAAGQILGVPLYDHIIITPKGHYSFRQNGLI